MINENDIQKYVEEVADRKKTADLQHKNLERRMKRDVLRAITDFNMIEDGETILLGVSGGKDSMLLGYLLSEVRKFRKKKFHIR